MTRILIIQGHPDPSPGHLCHALATAYQEGAEQAGHSVDKVCVATLSFPLIRSKQDFEHGERPVCIQSAQDAIRDCQHLVLIYPLWLGTLPALLKGFLEQVFRYDFAFEQQADGRFDKKLRGRSARVVVTMGMPALAFRWIYGAHSLKGLERNVLRFAGIAPVRNTLFGGVDDAGATRRRIWLDTMRDLGRAAR